MSTLVPFHIRRMPECPVWLNLAMPYDVSDNNDNRHLSSLISSGKRRHASAVSCRIDYKVLMFKDGYMFSALLVLNFYKDVRFSPPTIYFVLYRFAMYVHYERTLLVQRIVNGKKLSVAAGSVSS